IYKSTDAGGTWSHLGLRESRFVGRICIHPHDPDLVYVAALGDVFGANGARGVFRARDGGRTWSKVLYRDANTGAVDLAMDPRNPRILFAAFWQTRRNFWNISSGGPGSGLFRSTDGGASFTEIQTPHGDNHDLWIDPADPNRMIEGNDGGACVSCNGGQTWSSTDNQYPYRVYATQQDNTAISTPSAAAWGAITLGDCTYPGTGESGFVAVHPEDPNIVYCGAIGSSPGGAGALQRYDHRTGQIQLVNVWPEASLGIVPKDMRYRFAWTFPIAFSPHDSGILYAAGNHVFRSRDEGMSWEEISPDLSLNDISRQGPSGGDITYENGGAEVHATCGSLAPSPHRPGEIWASTDDGLVHVTRDDGNSWQNVTPSGMPELAYVGCVEISPHDADTIYVAATRYKLADYKPYLFRTTDGGRTFESISGDFPGDEIT